MGNRKVVRLGMITLTALALAACGGKDKKKHKDDDSSGDKGKSASSGSPSASVATKSSGGPAPQPPSSANRPPPPPPPKKLSEAEGKALLAQAVSAFQQPQHDCKKIIGQVYEGGAVVAAKDAQDALVAGAVCAESVHAYRPMLEFAGRLASANPDTLKLAMIPRALTGLGKLKEAEQAIIDINKKYPKEPAVMFAGVLLLQKAENWPVLLKAVDATITASKASKEPWAKNFVWRSELYRVMGLLKTGALPKVDAAIAAAEKAGAPPPVTDKIKKNLVPVKANKVLVDPEFPSHAYLGVYHLWGKAQGAGHFGKVSLYNFTAKDQQMKLEVEIPGITDKFTKNVSVLKGKFEVVEITPPLKADFKPAEQRDERQSQINVKVTLPGENDKNVYEESTPVKLMPRDRFPFSHQEFIGAWVTPQSKLVEKFLEDAKKRLPAGASFSGFQAPSVPQVKAIFEELKARNFSYVMIPTLGAEPDQYIRLPGDTLAHPNGMCADGAVLFATLLEKIGLHPFVVKVPGHMFMGWKAEPKDGKGPGSVFFLETTMVGNATFEQAMQVAEKEFAQHSAEKAATVIDVEELRKLGITAQPYE